MKTSNQFTNEDALKILLHTLNRDQKQAVKTALLEAERTVTRLQRLIEQLKVDHEPGTMDRHFDISKLTESLERAATLSKAIQEANGCFGMVTK